jgi:polysaccharide biosynthesis protein PslH
MYSYTRRAFPNVKPRFVLGLNDAIYRSYIEKGVEFLRGTVKRDLNALQRLLRAPGIAVHERHYLQAFDAVHVQTAREARRLRRILPKGKPPQLIIAPNGVDESLLRIEYDSSNSKDVVFVSHLQDGREKQAVWFVRDVWTRVQKQRPHARLHIFGQPGTPELVRQLESMGNVQAHGFAPSLRDVFDHRALSVVPVHQTCGLVTKVVDSMAAGVPVAGLQALYTLDGFENGVHGVANGNGSELAITITSLLDDPVRRRKMSRNARQFVQANFGWERTLDILTSALCGAGTASSRSARLTI